MSAPAAHQLLDNDSLAVGSNLWWPGARQAGSSEISGTSTGEGLAEMPAGPEDSQSDRKASRGAQGRVGVEMWHQGQQWEPQLPAGGKQDKLPSGDHWTPPRDQRPCFSFFLPKTSRQYQRGLSGMGVAKGIRGPCPEQLPPLPG